MKSPWWFVPTPFALLCGALSFGLLHLYTLVLALMMPPLFQLWREWPHVAWFSILMVLASPVWGVALLHHVGHGVLDVVDLENRKLGEGVVPRARSVWAGVFSWMVVLAASALATLVLLALRPPEAPEPDMLGALVRAASPAFGLNGVFSFYSAVWFALATFFYQVEATVRGEA